MIYKFTNKAKKVIEISNDISVELGHNYIGTEHLLYGLVKEGTGIAAKVLNNKGITEEKIKESQGILLKNENGQLLITKETLDNMIKSVVYKFDNIENCTPRISIDEQNEISITLQVVLKDDVIIKDLVNRLQTKVKEEMKKTSDLDVKNVNIKIINMSKKQEETKE